MTTCENCEHLHVVKGRIVEYRCPVTGIDFPAPGVSCETLNHGRSEIDPKTFYCGLAKAKENVKESEKNIIRVINGKVV